MREIRSSYPSPLQMFITPTMKHLEAEKVYSAYTSSHNPSLRKVGAGLEAERMERSSAAHV